MRYIYGFFYNKITRLISLRILPTISLRFIALIALKLGDGDHTRSKAEEKAAQDLKTRKDTIDAIKEKEAKDYLHKYDVGRKDTREERVGSGGPNNKNVNELAFDIKIVYTSFRSFNCRNSRLILLCTSIE